MSKGRDQKKEVKKPKKEGGKKDKTPGYLKK